MTHPHSQPDIETLLARTAAVICGASCGLVSECRSREAAAALLEAGLLAQSGVQSALEPFAKIAPSVEYTDKRDGETVHRQWDRDLKQYLILTKVTKDDFRRAAKAYADLSSSLSSAHSRSEP